MFIVNSAHFPIEDGMFLVDFVYFLKSGLIFFFACFELRKRRGTLSVSALIYFSMSSAWSSKSFLSILATFLWSVQYLRSGRVKILIPFSFFPRSLSSIRFEIKILLMEREYIQDQEYRKIVHNQTTIINALDEEAAQLRNILEYSDRNIGEARHNFGRGLETIARIRSNLDDIHHALRDIQKIAGIKVVIKEE